MSSSHGLAMPGTMASKVEVLAKATRRRFSAEYKLKILRAAKVCTQPGELGALLRREGLYSSNLRTWREQRRRGELQLPRDLGGDDAKRFQSLCVLVQGCLGG